jgi:hypothetical protein
VVTKLARVPEQVERTPATEVIVADGKVIEQSERTIR